MEKTTQVEFKKFESIPRLSRDCIITEKIDGTNGQVYIVHRSEVNDVSKFIAYDPYSEMYLFAGSRTRWVIPEDDNHGFAKWASDNALQLIEGLGPGRHYGEWWGQGIQRGYGLKEKRFSLFNVMRWIECPECITNPAKQKVKPACCHVVPVLYEGPFETDAVDACLCGLGMCGSIAAKDFNDPEGVVVYHIQSGHLFKKTLKNDEGKHLYKKPDTSSQV